MGHVEDMLEHPFLVASLLVKARRSLEPRPYVHEMGTQRAWGASSATVCRMSRKEAALISEQAKKVRNKAIPEWAEGLYHNKGLFSEVLAYYDEEAIYLECKGKDSGIVRFTFEMIEGLKRVEEETVEPEEDNQE
jgi:hypothetical protein